MSTTFRLNLAALALLLALAAFAKAPAFPVYRNLKVYTTSAPDKTDPAKIVARTQFVNDGNKPVRIAARLNASPALKIAGGRFTGRVQPGRTAVWRWAFTAPAGFTHEILTGGIDIDGARQRDLYVTIQGADPPDFDTRFVEKVTERARVVATYAPRNRRALLEEMQALEARKPKPVLTIAAGGKSDYVIVNEALPTDPVNDEQKYVASSVADLQRCIQLQSGAQLPVVPKTDGPAIILRLADLGDAAKGLHDAYRLRTDGQNVIIEAAVFDGLRNGVYGLLTDYLDCHWFQPKELGEEIVIPKDKTVRLPVLNEVCGSKWMSTGGASWNLPPEWNIRNRAYINRNRMSFGHAWQEYINKNEFPYDKYPEYYARDRQGKVRVCDPPDAGTSTNLCTTNPQVIEIVAKKVNAFFAAHPDAIVKSLDPNDYAPMCLCDNCLVLDKKFGQTREDGAQVADRLLQFSTEIYNRLEPRFKDRFLGILIYGFQMDAPHQREGPQPPRRHDLRHDLGNTTTAGPSPTPPAARNRVFCDLVKKWGQAIPQLGFYDYYGHFFFFGPWGMVHKMREDLPAVHALGGTYVIPEDPAHFRRPGAESLHRRPAVLEPGRRRGYPHGRVLPEILRPGGRAHAQLLASHRAPVRHRARRPRPALPRRREPTDLDRAGRLPSAGDTGRRQTPGRRQTLRRPRRLRLRRPGIRPPPLRLRQPVLGHRLGQPGPQGRPRGRHRLPANPPRTPGRAAEEICPR